MNNFRHIEKLLGEIWMHSQKVLIDPDEEFIHKTFNEWRFISAEINMLKRDAKKWEWAKNNLISMEIKSDISECAVTTICPKEDTNTEFFWDDLAERELFKRKIPK